MGIEIKKQEFQIYFSDSNNQISNSDIAQLNSIFDECDTDRNNILQNDEVPTFQKMVSIKLNNLWNQVKAYIDGLGGMKPVNDPEPLQNNNPNVTPTETHRTEEEQKEYTAKLEQAIQILKQNATSLGLTQEELSYLDKIDVESITYGSARYSRESDKVLFNINDNIEPNVGNFVKVLIHEITHGIKKNESYGTEQELACETRAIEVAKKAFDMGLFINQNGGKDNFIIYGEKGRLFRIKDMDDKGKQVYLNTWIKNYQ